jgi:hypothetical protein
MALQAYILVNMDEKDFKEMGFGITRDQMFTQGAPKQGTGKYKAESFIDGRFGPLTRKGLSLIQDVPPDISQEIKFADGKIVVAGMSTQDTTNEVGYQDDIPLNMADGGLSVTNVDNFAEDEQQDTTAVVDDTDVAQAQEAEITADAENNAQQQQQPQQEQQQVKIAEGNKFVMLDTTLGREPIKRVNFLIDDLKYQVHFTSNIGRMYIFKTQEPYTPATRHRMGFKAILESLKGTDDEGKVIQFFQPGTDRRLKLAGISTQGLHLVPRDKNILARGGDGVTPLPIIFPIKPNQITAMVKDLYLLKEGQSKSFKYTNSANETIEFKIQLTFAQIGKYDDE